MPEMGTDLRRVAPANKGPSENRVTALAYPRGSGSGHTAVRKATWWPPVLDRRAATPRAALWRSTFPLFQPPPTPKPPSVPSRRAGGWQVDR
jgi:hypothetical protein